MVMRQSVPHREAETLVAISPVRRRGVLIAMCISLVLVVASVSSLNLALPELALSLRASSTSLTWIADGYTIALAALMIQLGAFCDRVGRRTWQHVVHGVCGATAL